MFVYDGLTFDVFVVAFENIEVSLPFRSVDRTAIRQADTLGPTLNKFYLNLSIERIAIRPDHHSTGLLFGS